MNPCREAQEDDLPAVRQLLADNGLVHEDLVASTLRTFVVREDEQSSTLAAVAGLETFAGCRDGLLRSVAVCLPRRGQGIGAVLVEAIETRARELGVQKLWLLTTTAPAFFARLNYREIDRASAPEPLQQSDEFNGLCPASAVCLSKAL